MMMATLRRARSIKKSTRWIVLLQALLVLPCLLTRPFAAFAPVAAAQGEAGATCDPSPLPGFQYSVKLNNRGLILHWKAVNSTTVNFAAQALAGPAAAGWFAVGWSGSSGGMVPGEAVIGNLPGGKMDAYSLGFYAPDGVIPTKSFSIGSAGSDAKLTKNTDNSFIMKFSRSVNDGKAKVLLKGINSMIWAYSDGSQTLAQHLPTNKGSLSVDYSCPSFSGSSGGNNGSSGGNSGSGGSSNSSSGSSGGNSSGSGGSSGSSSQANGSGCQPSSLPGYTCSVQLSKNAYTLHWAVNKDSTVSMAAQVATTGFVGIGFSKDGKMTNSDAAIGNVPPGALANGAAVGAYYLGGRDVGSVQPTDTWSVTNTSVTTSNGYTTMVFTRSMGTGHVPIDASAPTTIIWAYSPDGSTALAYHASNFGSASIDFVKGTSTAGQGSSTAAYIAHGVLLALAFALLMPLAILLARLLLADRPHGALLNLNSGKDLRPLGFQLHRGIQLSALVVAVAGMIVIFVQAGSKGLSWTHGQVGLAAVILALLQAVVGFIRPDKTAPNRFKWLVAHCVIGATTIALAWTAMFLGIDLYHTKFMENVTWCYWVTGICVSMFGFMYLLLVIPDSILSSMKPKEHKIAGKGGTAGGV